MTEREGVIKYSLTFSMERLALNSEVLERLNVARTQMVSECLMGADPERYGGLGFGNLSLRNAAKQQCFLISGSQTGHLGELTEKDVACVTQTNAAQNTLTARGLCKPSSEAMTHGVLYQTCHDVNAVIHVHSPEIWYYGDALGLPSTSDSVAYGTPAMAAAVAALCIEKMPRDRPLVFTMRGHVDGVVAAGRDLSECASALLGLLLRVGAMN